MESSSQWSKVRTRTLLLFKYCEVVCIREYIDKVQSTAPFNYMCGSFYMCMCAVNIIIL